MKRHTIRSLGATAAILAAVFATGCSMGEGNPTLADSGSSQGGSMARFTIAGDFLYTVNDSELTVVSITDPARPSDIGRVELPLGGVETIFSMDTLLFIGSRAAMHVYNISRPEFPTPLAVTPHLYSCDPVVAADTLAFVTLNSSLGRWCGRSRNVLLVYNMSNLDRPVIIAQVEAELSSPRGLAVDIEQKIVFVCDNGVKAYDFTDPRRLRGLYTSGSLPEVGPIDAYDCILWEGRLLVIGADGLYQLGYDREKFTFISKMDLRAKR